MEKFNKIAMGLATAAVIALPGMAQAAVIDGINVGTGVLTFVASTIMEQRGDGTPSGTTITGNGQTLMGVGNVTEIRSDGVLVWSPSVGNELTFAFNNYTSFGFTGAEVGFYGGKVNFYHDTNAATGANYSTGTGFGADPGSSLWLALQGVAFSDPLHPGYTNTTLFGTGSLNGSPLSVTGVGLLEVTGLGLADSYFNTNAITAAGTGNKADWEISTAANNQSPNGFLYGTHGTASISNIRTVPEPATVALMALGLLGIGFSSRKYGRTK